MQFSALLKKYKAIPQALPKYSKPKSHHSLPPPRIATSYVPIPKSYKPTRQTVGYNLLHPMRLRNQSYHPQSFKHRAATHLLAQNITENMLHVFNPSGKKQTIDTLLQTNPIVWQPALSNEIGRLAQGIGIIIGNDALDFVH